MKVNPELKFPVLRILCGLGMILGGLALPAMVLAAEMEGEHRIVATVLQENIRFSRIFPSSEVIRREKEHLDEGAFKNWLIGYQERQITDLIINPLLNRYVRDNQLEPTAEELQSFVYSLHQSRKEDLRRSQEQRDHLRQQFKGGDLTDSQGQAIQGAIRKLDQSIDEINRLQGRSGESTQDLLEAEKTIAQEFVQRWKVNRALYQKYGGRVVFQQSGPEPVDAYRAFFEDEERKGSFRIYDPALKQLFWRFFIRDTTPEVYRDEDTSKIFAQPWW